MKQTSEQKLETSSIYEGARLLFEYKKDSGISISNKTIVDKFRLESIPHLRTLKKNKYLEFKILSPRKKKFSKISEKKAIEKIKTFTSLKIELRNVKWWDLARFAYEQIAPFII